MAIPVFQWAAGGRPVSPEEAARQRRVAEALIARTQTPAKNWAEGLSQLAGAYTGTVLQDRAGEAEQAGAAEAAALFHGLSSSSPEQDIIAALSNPWTNDGQSRVASALLGNKFQQASSSTSPETFFGTPVPYDQGGQIGFGQLGNQGTFKPIDLPEGATPAPTTRTIDTPTEVITTDVYGNELYRTPKDNRTAESDKAAGRVEGEREGNLPVLRSKAQTTIAAYELQNGLVNDNIDRALSKISADPWFTTGAGAALTAWAPGSPGQSVAEDLNTIKANIGFDKLQQMREASPTGGALGQVSDFENRQLQAIFGSLEQSQTVADLTYNLRRLKDTLAQFKALRSEAFARDFGGEDDDLAGVTIEALPD